MMLLKRIRVVNVAPFLFLRWTPCLLFIFLLTPLENSYAQDDDSGEIFWGEDEEEDDEFFEEDEEFLEDDEGFDEDPDAFFDEEEGEDVFVDEGEFEEDEFDEGELSSTELSDNAMKVGYTLTIHGASPGLVSHSLYTYNSFVNFRLGVDMPILMQVMGIRFRLGAELGTVKFEDYYPPATATYSGMTLIGLVSVPAGASQVKLGGGLVSGSIGMIVESTYGFTLGNALGIRIGMRYTGSTGAKNSEDEPFEGPASWLEGVFVLAVTL
jgi:hypothetical protein